MWVELLLIIYGIMIILCLGVFTALWARRPLRIKAGLFMLPACTLLLLGASFQLMFPNYNAMLFLYYWNSLAFIFIITSLVFFVLEFTKVFNWRKKTIYVAIVFIPTLAFFLIGSDPWLHLYNNSYELATVQGFDIPYIRYDPTYGNFLWTAYSFVVAILFIYIMAAHLYKNERTIFWIFVPGVAVMSSLNAAAFFLQDLNAVPFDGLSFTSVALSFYLAALVYGLFDLVPLARNKMLDIMEDSVIAIDPTGIISDVNLSSQRMLGFGRDDLVGKRIEDITEKAKWLSPLSEKFEDHAVLPEIKDGQGRPYDVRILPLEYGRSKNGRLVILTNVTQRKKMEEAIRAADAQKRLADSERRYRTVVDNQTEAIISFRPDGTITFANSILEKYLAQIGLNNSSVRIQDILSEEDIGRLMRSLARLTPASPINELELSMEGPEQRPVYILLRMKGLFDSAQSLHEIQAVGINITERRELERELIKNSKLESLGVLAGGIAHDFNNMLASIVSNIEIASIDLPEGSRPRRRLDESVRSAMRARNLTQQLLTFSKGGQPIKVVFDLAPLVRSSSDFVLAGSTVAAAYEFEEGLFPVNADPTQVEQVINNLVLNATQAMPRGGHLIIRISNVPIAGADQPPAQQAPYVRMDIIDEGVGISAEDLDRIFDPFFTTKETGKGLGLSTVQSIVRNHGGFIRVDSEVGKGTMMSVFLPAADSTVNVPVPEDEQEEIAQTHGRVLVMDDEEPILEVMTLILQEYGYEPVCVKDGKEAIATYRQAMADGQPFNAVIMDLTIRGGMGGKEAAHEILSFDPEAKLMVSSGYSNDPIMAHPNDYGFRDVLPKPFSMQDLVTKISALMAGIGQAVEDRTDETSDGTEAK